MDADLAELGILDDLKDDEEEEDKMEKSKFKKEFKKAEVGKKIVEVTEIATQTSPAFRMSDGRVLNLYEYLAWLGDSVAKIKEAVV